jgi:phage repressor protein C with HTH and peptisase S24 domain
MSRRQAQQAIIDAENKRKAAAAQMKLEEERVAAQKELYEQLRVEQKKREEEQAAAQTAWEEQLRAVQEAKLERERKAARKERLRRDPSALYRHYYEYLEFFPIPKGERMNEYCMTLLANRKTIGIEPDSDAGLAIQYAKDHWEFYLTNKDQDKAIEWQKEKLAELKADAPVTSIANNHV